MFKIIPSEFKQEITPNKIEIIKCDGYMFYTHKYGDKVIITSGLYVFLVITALLCFIIIGLDCKLYIVALFGSISTLLIIIILCNVSIFWQYINQTLLMLITNIIVLLLLLLLFISVLRELYNMVIDGDNINAIITRFIVICIIVLIFTVMYLYIPIPDTSYWLVVNSPVITSIIFGILLIVIVVVIVGAPKEVVSANNNLYINLDDGVNNSSESDDIT